MFWKRVVRKTLARMGYSIRSINGSDEICGVDLGHDLRICLRDKMGPVLFDVGANTGQTIGFMLDNFREPRIVAFEPSPATFAALNTRFGNKPNIRLENKALSAERQTSILHVTRGSSVNDSLLEPVWDAGAQKVDIQVDTVDQYCQDHGIEVIDSLKIDTQGNDLNVLRGATRMLAGKKVRTLYVEVIFTSLYKGQPALTDFLSLLTSFEYQLLGIYDQNYLYNRLWYCNACFVAA